MTDRNRQLARIHCLKRDLTLDDDTYQDVLWTLCRVRSAKELDATGRGRVIGHLVSLAHRAGVNTGRKGKPRNARNWDRQALVSKIEAQLADAGRPWAYATSMARHMFDKDALEFCTGEELHKIVAALSYDAKRRAARASAARDAEARAHLAEMLGPDAT